MRYSLNPEFDQRLKEAFDEFGIEEEIEKGLFRAQDRAAIVFSDKVCLRIARNLVEEGLSPEKIKRITGCDCDISELVSIIH